MALRQASACPLCKASVNRRSVVDDVCMRSLASSYLALRALLEDETGVGTLMHTLKYFYERSLSKASQALAV